MGRYGRINYPNLIYHIINRGNNRDIVFVEEEDYYHYLNTIQRYKKKYQFHLYAYCLMTNHVHLLIKVTDQGNISRIMQSITVAHTRWYNFKYRRCGHVWQGRFHSPIVSEDGHLLKVMQYIEQNPVRAKMVEDPVQYRYSSYRLNIRKKDSKLIDRSENKVFHILGENLQERIYNYRQLMESELEADQLKRIRYSTRNGGHYISEKFQGQIAQLLPKKRGRGRPRTRPILS